MTPSGEALGLEACRAVLQNRDFEVLDLDSYFADLEQRGRIQLPNIRSQIQRLLFFVRGETHLRLRRAVLDFFTPKTIAAWLPVIARSASETVARLDGCADVVASFAAPVSSDAVCRVLGLPVAQRPDFDRWAEEIRWLTEPMLSMRQLRSIETTLEHFARAVRAAAAAPPAEPGTFLHRPIAGLDAEDRVWLTIILYGAGQSTLHTLANILLRVLQEPVERRAILTDPAQYMAATDRLIAQEGSIQFISRLSNAGSGERVDLPLAKINGAAFPACPFDPASGPATAHLAFGAGMHKCVGALLARFICAEALASFFRRYPSAVLERAPSGFQTSVVLVSPLDLPVILEPTGQS